MKIIQSGDIYEIYDSGVRTYDKLPPKTYTVEYDERRGCFLAEHSDMEALEKAYGTQAQKVEKVMKTFEIFPRSLGVLLVGDKGTGKTMFAKRLCIKATEQGIPVILVDEAFPQIVRFIEKIDQQCLVLFDEFDKTFNSHGTDDDEYEYDGPRDDQSMLLSLFDGTSGGKKLFVITCNRLNLLNECLINRPGRFHYHFRFECPTQGEIEEYMKDNLATQYHKDIPEVVSFAKRACLNYDCLRAIAFELNKESDESVRLFFLRLAHKVWLLFDGKLTVQFLVFCCRGALYIRPQWSLAKSCREDGILPYI